MYLKYIEINGFKSFANRTKIEFFPGINIIVGPNGAGKSNIVDAIKWSIGEMSSKSLRMPSMMDVIFAGTTKRSPMNFAEVTLIFDNSERKLNFDFNEVAITRKIYRSEESEYFINRVPCRLRDIREMFLDTGIGSNGYAIIDQGELEEILLSDTIEKREILEEVAGISKYKAKREETLRKLEKVDVDLSIVENSVAIIEEQIRKLELEAKRARLQQKYREELKEAEIAYNVKLIINYNNELEKEKENIKPIINEISSINTETDEIGAELTKKDLLLNDKINEDRDLLDKISNIKSEIVRVEGTIIKNENLIEEITKQLNDLNITHTRNLENENKFISLVEEKRKRKEELHKVVVEAENKYNEEKKMYEEVELKITDVDRKIKELESISSISYQNEINLSNLLVRTESELAHIKEDIIVMEKDKLKLENEKSEIYEKIKELEEKIGNINLKRQAIEDELLSKTEKKNLITHEIDKMDEEISSLSMEKVSLSAKLDSILEEAKKDSYWIGTNEILSLSMDGVYGVLRSLLNFSPEDRVIIEDLFGRFIDAIVVKDRETALKCIEHLKNTGKGRARFIILSNVPQVEANNTLFSSKISISDEYKNLLNFFISRVNVDNEIINGDIWMIGGVKEINSPEYYWQDSEDIKKRLKIIDDTLSSINLKKEENEKKLNELDVLIKKLLEDKNNIEIELINLTNTLNNFKEKLSVLDENIKFIEDEIIKFKSKEEELNALIIKYKTEVNELRIKTGEKQKELIYYKDERVNLEKEIIEKRAKLSDAHHRLENIKNEISRLDIEINELSIELNSIEFEKNQYSRRKQELEKRIENLKNEISELKIKYEELHNDRKELEIKKAQLGREIDDIKNEISQLNMVLKENNEVLKEQIDKKQEIELRINTINTKINDIIEKLNSEYQISYDEVMEKYKDFDVNLERIEYLKKRIENMGAVNMTAPQEYEALLKEYNEKKLQIEDLKKAKEDLKQAIAKINQTTKENFKTTFEKVNEYLQKIYVMLFEGGEARLVLTDPDNLLETGVDIIARPPGKKPVNISQLSGGEKSLVALSLLFSFFCVNPSPFCVMDEVDAALDEANVERFVKLLKEFSPQTQFIVITHNKRTMEVADVIYGVTMEELGVSRIISVDLKKARDMAEVKT